MFELKVIFELPISLTIYFGLLKTPFRKKVASFLFVATSSRYDSIIFFRIIWINTKLSFELIFVNQFTVFFIEEKSRSRMIF